MTFQRSRQKAAADLRLKADPFDAPLDEIEFFVQGVPQAWQRAGVNFKKGVHFTQPETEKWKERLVWSARAAKKLPKNPTSWPCFVWLLFFFPEPKGYRLSNGIDFSAEARKHVYDGELICENSKDVDNLAKSVLDAFNGLIWVDDHKCRLREADKVYTRGEPGVQIRVTTPRRRG